MGREDGKRKAVRKDQGWTGTAQANREEIRPSSRVKGQEEKEKRNQYAPILSKYQRLHILWVAIT
jgi:hypothetical protein